MNKRRWLRIVAFILLAGSAPWWTPRAYWMAYGWRHHEPFYRGWPASYWKRELRDPNLHTGIDTLDDWLRQRLPPRLRAGVTDELASGGRLAVPVLIAALEDEDEDTRAGAAQVILRMPPHQAESAVPALIRVARRLPTAQASSSARTAFEALVWLGPDVTAYDLAVAVHDSDAAVRHGAVEVLRYFGQDAASAAPLLVLALSDPDYEVRSDAVSALRQVDPDSAPPWRSGIYPPYPRMPPPRYTSSRVPMNLLGLPRLAPDVLPLARSRRPVYTLAGPNHLPGPYRPIVNDRTILIRSPR